MPPAGGAVPAPRHPAAVQVHRFHLPHVADAARRVAPHHHHVGQLARLEAPQGLLDADRGGGAEGAGVDGLHRRPARAHERLHLHVDRLAAAADRAASAAISTGTASSKRRSEAPASVPTTTRIPASRSIEAFFWRVANGIAPARMPTLPPAAWRWKAR